MPRADPSQWSMLTLDEPRSRLKRYFAVGVVLVVVLLAGVFLFSPLRQTDFLSRTTQFSSELIPSSRVDTIFSNTGFTFPQGTKILITFYDDMQLPLQQTFLVTESGITETYDPSYDMRLSIPIHELSTFEDNTFCDAARIIRDKGAFDYELQIGLGAALSKYGFLQECLG